MRTNREEHPRWQNGRGFPALCGSHAPCEGLRGRIRQHGSLKDQAQHSTDGENAIRRSRGTADCCCFWVGQPNRERCCSKTCPAARRRGKAQAQKHKSGEQRRVPISVDARSSWRQFLGYLLKIEWSILSRSCVTDECPERGTEDGRAERGGSHNVLIPTVRFSK